MYPLPVPPNAFIAVEYTAPTVPGLTEVGLSVTAGNGGVYGGTVVPPGVVKFQVVPFHI